MADCLSSGPNLTPEERTWARTSSSASGPALNLRESGEDIADYAELERFLPKYTAVFTEKEITIEGLKKTTQVIPYRITERDGATLRGETAHGAAPLRIDFESDEDPHPLRRQAVRAEARLRAAPATPRPPLAN